MELNKLQKLILKTVAESGLQKDFYWTGGTPLALFYLNHRQSLDLDFFSDHPVNYHKITRLIKEISKKTGLKKIEEKKIFDRWEFLLSNDKKARVEFVHYDFPALEKRKKWQGIFVDSLTDMVANKTMALIDRHEPKDVFDIYFLLKKQKFTPEEILKLAKKKFGLEISRSVFWSEALLGAKELERIKILLLGTPANKLRQIEKVQEFFRKSSAQYLRKQFDYE